MRTRKEIETELEAKEGGISREQGFFLVFELLLDIREILQGQNHSDDS